MRLGWLLCLVENTLSGKICISARVKGVLLGFSDRLLDYYFCGVRTMRKILFSLLLCLLFCSLLAAQEQTNARARWFTDARFGMFIHWGVYSGAEGIWKGERHRDDNNYAEWILYRNRIARDEYLTLLDRFDWASIDPEQWVLLAKRSGMKYVTLTAKHHDGFALWDSEASHYDVGDYTDPKRDIVRELADACRKHGLKLGLYYSHWVDWEHAYGWDHTREIRGITAQEYDQYWQEKVVPQLRELLTNYGEIGLLWFDMWKHHSETVVTRDQLLQIKKLIRDLQPNCLVNSRLGLSVEEDRDVDFQTLGDNQLGSHKRDFPWQSPATVAHSWGFHALDSEWKSTTTLLKSLINNVSLNGNFMLNIGPRANGQVPFEISQRMLEMGRWLAVNGDSIYGAQAFDLRKDQHDWGKMTRKATAAGDRLFLHVFNWPLNRELFVTGVKTAPEKVFLLADKQQAPLSFTQRGPVTHVQLPPLQPDPYVSVVVMAYEDTPEIVDGLAARTVDGGYSLTPQNQCPPDEKLVVQKKQRRGTVPGHVIVKEKKVFRWKIYVDEPVHAQVDVSYSFQHEASKARIVMRAAHDTLSHRVTPTGKTIGEPKQNWVIDNFRCTRLGEVPFSEPGFYEVELEVVPGKGEAVQFQWLWLK